MAATLPHVTVIVNHAKEMSQLPSISRSAKMAYRFHFLCLWLDAFVCQVVAQVLKTIPGKEALAHICSEAFCFESG